MDLRAGVRVTESVELVRPLGEGGMGAVWVGRHVGLDREVAVKFISPEIIKRLGKEIVDRFQREARAAAKLKSPYVVQTHDTGVASDGTPYIVMELLHGESLEEHLLRAGSMPAERCVLVIDQVSRALAEAHAAGTVHRDIKPDNIFMSQIGGELICKLLDFGIAVQLGDARMTATGMTLGTPQYMSPEQMKDGKHVDHRTDIWALGAVVYRMLTGHDAFAGDTAVSLWMAKSQGAFQPVPSGSVRPEIDGWLKRALAPNPGDRFQDVREMALSLSTALGAAQAAGPPASTRREGPLLDQPAAAMSSRAVPTTKAAVVGVASGGPRKSKAAIALVAGAVVITGVGIWVGVRSRGADSDADDFTSRRERVAEPAGAARAAPKPVATSSAATAFPSEEDDAVSLPAFAPQLIHAGRVGPAWMPAFTIVREESDANRTYLEAQDACRERGTALCTEMQHQRACAVHPHLGSFASWTASLADDAGVVVRGGASCDDRRIVAGSERSAVRAGACCTRVVPLVTSNTSVTFLAATHDKLLAFERALDSGSAASVAQLFDGDYKQGKLRRAALAHYQKYFTGTSDQWTLYDRCDLSIKNDGGASQWVAECRTISQKDDAMSLVVMRYVRGGSAGLLLEMTTPRTLRKFGVP